MMEFRVSDATARHLHKVSFYAFNALRSLFPAASWRLYRRLLMRWFESLPDTDQRRLKDRADYYNRLIHPFLPDAHTESIGHFRFAGKSSAYCYDFQNMIRCFPPTLSVAYRFGDITEVPPSPCFVKSRPIGRSATNRNAVLLKLNTVRHYRFVTDHTRFEDKLPMAVWRGKSNNALRIRLASRFMNHPLCNIGCTRHKEPSPQPYHRDFMGITEQLRYRYIVSVEGVDVATNLKWIMASNSLCLMRKPRFETWFMEGTLIPGIHYVQLEDDYADLIDKIDYYNRHPAEARAIIANAQAHVAQFRHPREEAMVTMLVIEKYLRLSQQTRVGDVSVPA